MADKAEAERKVTGNLRRKTELLGLEQWTQMEETKYRDIYGKWIVNSKPPKTLTRKEEEKGQMPWPDLDSETKNRKAYGG